MTELRRYPRRSRVCWAHGSETVLRSFYDFHLEAGSGPIVNPFPLVRERVGARAHAHHNPVEPFAKERSGRYRPRLDRRVPRRIPDERFNQVFAQLRSDRDRALVAFWVSTGARAAEVLQTTRPTRENHCRPTSPERESDPRRHRPTLARRDPIRRALRCQDPCRRSRCRSHRLLRRSTLRPP